MFANEEEVQRLFLKLRDSEPAPRANLGAGRNHPKRRFDERRLDDPRRGQARDLNRGR